MTNEVMIKVHVQRLLVLGGAGVKVEVEVLYVLSCLCWNTQV
jgi:hypothetical protein